MLRNILRLDSLFSPFARSRGQTGFSHAVDFAPIERKTRGKIPEKRSATGDFKSNFSMLLASPSSSGAVVNEHTALNVAAVTACVGLLADMIAKLPVYLYRDTPKGPKEITNHPGAALIGRFPSDMHTSFELRQLMETGKGLGGNGYARVYRDAFGDPRSIQWLAPCDVEPRLIKRGGTEKMVVYHVQGEKEPLTRYDIIHVRGFSRDGYTGLSPIRLLRDSIGTALTQTAAAGTLMKNGARFPGLLTSDTIHKKETIDDARAEWDRNTTGASLNRTPILNGSFKFQQTSGMSMVDAQFLESRRFELQEIARLYRIPPFMIGDSTASTTWGTGIEQQTLGFLNFCLDPHLIGWEQSLGHTLLTTEEQRKGLYFRFDRDQLANVALEARAAFYTAMRTAGVYSPNDIRRKENEPLISPEDGGDTYGNPNTMTAEEEPPALEPANDEEL
jgi:HK97 family phage portal protein